MDEPAEAWFGIVECQAISKGVFPSVKYLNARIRISIDGRVHRSHLFVCTKTDEKDFAKTNRSKPSNADH